MTPQEIQVKRQSLKAFFEEFPKPIKNIAGKFFLSGREISKFNREYELRYPKYDQFRTNCELYAREFVSHFFPDETFPTDETAKFELPYVCGVCGVVVLAVCVLMFLTFRMFGVVILIASALDTHL